MRKQFISDVSHELKTPLSSIKVLSESILLQKDVPRETYIEFLEDITSEGYVNCEGPTQAVSKTNRINNWDKRMFL